MDVAQQRCAADLIVAADTVVELDGEILEKPADPAHARDMLARLSNTSHIVHTGVALSTTVLFSALTPADIDLYVASGEPVGKAGAYGIQGTAGAWVVRIDGCYNNVVGFPLHAFAAHVSQLVQEQLL
ncbi:hypothetical protein WJX81_004988 [Elliptochloris bilobata]|uniref:Maf-like protein n=1 Tax=Elliptochloris bilobata TaxID=381761 RepID=A0AAW1S0K7_9CHLO